MKPLLHGIKIFDTNPRFFQITGIIGGLCALNSLDQKGLAGQSVVSTVSGGTIGKVR